jgi:hypothetical protein
MTTRKCNARKKNTTECDADAQVGKDVCVFHDPTKAAQVHKARRAGGLRRSRPAAVLPRQTPDHPLGNTTEVSAFLAKSINDVLRGALDPRVANSAGYLANILLRSLEQGPLEERLARLEASLGIAKNPHTAASGKDPFPV